MNNIFTFGDGYASGHIWPEWPDILSGILPNYSVVNTSGIGAGNEFIVNAVLAQAEKVKDGIFIIQWAIDQRFDKVLEDNSWDNIISADETYSNNQYSLGDNLWWISSASIQLEIKLYHQFYITKKQAALRTLNYILLLKNYFENRKLKYYFLFTHAPSSFTSEQKTQIESATWLWHSPWQGMSEFSLLDEFAKIRQNEVQPGPVVHLEWLIRHLLPEFSGQIDNFRLEKLSNLIKSTTWEPFHWDRKQIWVDIIKNIDN